VKAKGRLAQFVAHAAEKSMPRSTHLVAELGKVPHRMTLLIGEAAGGFIP
jgi:hypothetical protein